MVISGAFSGMGLAAARLLSQLGADVYAICRRNGRHNTLDFPVKKILYADFGSKEDLDLLAEALPDNIYAMFLCHGIALKKRRFKHAGGAKSQFSGSQISAGKESA